jgi:hypothetical protein
MPGIIKMKSYSSRPEASQNDEKINYGNPFQQGEQSAYHQKIKERVNNKDQA